MKVSVIVCTYTKERLNDVLKCLHSLLDQTTKPDEILLVLDPVDELVQFYEERIPNNVKIVRSHGFGLSEARNTGLKVARGDIIAFIDDDAWADKYWLENMLKNFEDKEVWVVGGKIVPVFDKKRPKWLAEELDWIVGCTYKAMPKNKSEIRNPIGANMGFKREAFKIAGYFRSEVGRYGKKLLSGEEAEFAMRLKKLKPNVKIIYDPSVIVYHRVPESRATLKYAFKRAYYEGYSKAILSREYNLDTEYKYAKTLISSILRRIVRFKFSECITLILVVFIVFFGNIVGKLRLT